MSEPLCQQCPLNEEGAPRVIARGKKTAQVMVIGQSPGEDEVKALKPSIGPAGQCLDELLARAGFDLTQVAYTNAMRCRPPDGFKFTRKILDCCAEPLKDLVRLVRPKLIICTGNEAWASLMGGNPTGVEKGAGSIVTHPDFDCPVLWTHHPAKVLFNPGCMQQTIGHLRKAKFVMENGGQQIDPAANAKKILVRDLESLKKLVAYCRKRGQSGEVMAFDIESTGKDRFLDNIIGVGFGFHDFGAYVPLKHGVSHMEMQEVTTQGKTKEVLVEVWDLVTNPETGQGEGLGLVRELLEDSSIPKCAHFSKFDATFFMHEYGIHPTNITDDPLLLQMLVDENSMLSLKYLAKQRYGAADWDAALDSYRRGVGGKNLSQAPLKQVAEYCCLDVIYTARLAKLLRAEATANGSINVHDNLLLPLNYELGQIELRGMQLDEEAVQEVGRRLEKRMEELVVELNEVSGLADTKLPCRNPKDKQIGVNPGSDADMRWVLFDYLELPVVKYTNEKQDTPSTDDEVRSQLLEMDKVSAVAKVVIRCYHEYKALQKFYGTYVKGNLECLRRDGRVHPTYGYNEKTERSPNTGRLSCSSPNMQNQPSAFQPCFVPPPGHLIVQPDHKAIEVRVWAAYSRDPELIRYIGTPGLDFHREMGAVALAKRPEDVTDEERKLSKILVFGGIMFGGDEHVVAKRMGCTKEEGRVFLQRIYDRFAIAKAWLDSKVREANENHQVVSMIGRVRHLEDITSIKRDVRQEAERVATNSPVQGYASDINNMGAIEMSDWFRWYGTNAPWLPRDDETSWEWLERRRTYNRDIEDALREIREKGPALRSRIVNLIHDCQVDEVPFEEEELVLQLLNTKMTRRPHPDWPAELPLAVEIAVTKRWHDDELNYNAIVGGKDTE